MKEVIYSIKQNKEIAKNTFELILCGDTDGIKPGQFVNLSIEKFFLRRPISVCDAEDGILTLIYKTVGNGTESLSKMQSGQSLDILTCLGNGYDLSVSGKNPLLIGGGAGVPPLYMLAKKFVQQGKEVSVILGFNSKSEVFYKKEFERLSAHVLVTTVDGSEGTKGFVTDVMGSFDYSYIYACGPLPMLKNVQRMAKSQTQLSMEERMGCGFGACMGCSHKTTNGFKRVCKEGPVFFGEEVCFE